MQLSMLTNNLVETLCECFKNAIEECSNLVKMHRDKSSENKAIGEHAALL